MIITSSNILTAVKEVKWAFHKVIETIHQLSDFENFLFVPRSKHLSRYSPIPLSRQSTYTLAQNKIHFSEAPCNKNKLQKLEDALLRQMLASADLADRGDIDDRGDMGDRGDIDDRGDMGERGDIDDRGDMGDRGDMSNRLTRVT